MTFSIKPMIRMGRMGLGLALVLGAVAGSALGMPLPPAVTPEIDPGSMGSALTLLAGGVLMLTGKARRG